MKDSFDQYLDKENDKTKVLSITFSTIDGSTKLTRDVPLDMTAGQVKQHLIEYLNLQDGNWELFAFKDCNNHSIILNESLTLDNLKEQVDITYIYLYPIAEAG